MSSELTRAMKWIHDTLANDATITSQVGNRIYQKVAPTGVTYPFIIISMQAAEDDTRGIGAKRVWSQFHFLVKAVDQASSYDTIEPIADRIDALLHGQASISVTGGIIKSCIRLRPQEMAQDYASKSYRHLGAMYWVISQ